jgi:hypothetical protein
MKTCVTVTCDNAYINYAIALLNSCKRNISGHVDVILRYVCEESPPDILHCFDMLIEDNQPRCTTRKILGGGFDSMHSRNQTNSGTDKLVSEKQLYCTHSKYKNCLEAFDMGYNRVIVTDADTIIRRDITTHPIMGISYDIAMKKTNAFPSYGYTHQHVFEEGFFIINNTAASHQLMNRVVNKLDAEKKSNEIHMDSDTLLIGNEIHTGDYEYTELPEELKDEDCKDSSYVWSGRAGAKETQIYLQEVNAYL